MQLDPDFREFVESFNERDVDGLPLEIIGRDDLIRNEVAADRPQDRADVARLTQVDSAD